MILSCILAMAKNRVIGQENKLPWHLPEDLNRFRQITRGHPIIMGRKTFESIGRILPERENIVVTRNRDYVPPLRISEKDRVGQTKLTLRYSLEDALAPFRNTDEEVFVIGGAELFKEAMGQMDRFYLTVIDRNFEGDVCLPQFDLNKFDLTSEIKKKNEDFEYYFRDYQRNLSI